MGSNEKSHTWLELKDNSVVEIPGSCSIGRSAENQIILPDGQVSRQHALIHQQDSGESILIDLGSNNGTYLNGRRVVSPTPLKNGDTILIGSWSCVYRKSVAQDSSSQNSTATAPEPAAPATLINTQTLSAWLVVADVIGCAKLAQSLGHEEWGKCLREWICEMGGLVQSHGGCVEQSRGDSVLAVWDDETSNPSEAAKALMAFKDFQPQSRLPFRFVAHHGRVFFRGVIGADRVIHGSELVMAFRMERLASTLGCTRLLSSVANQKIGTILQTNAVEGRHRLKGFDEEFSFFTF